MQLIQPFGYFDSCGKKWAVPPNAKVNGASIPPWLWAEVGPPFVGKYRNASVVHDWYCSVRTEPYVAVHQMFYEAMLASGLSWAKATLMYAGVRIGGPTWDEMTIANQRLERVAATAAPPPPSSESGMIVDLAAAGITQAEYIDAVGVRRQEEVAKAEYFRISNAIAAGYIKPSNLDSILYRSSNNVSLAKSDPFGPLEKFAIRATDA